MGCVIYALTLQVTLKLQPIFKRSISYLTKDDSDLGDQVATCGNQHEFADIIWYPSQCKAVYHINDHVSTNTYGEWSIQFNLIPPHTFTQTGLYQNLRLSNKHLPTSNLPYIIHPNLFAFYFCS